MLRDNLEKCSSVDIYAYYCRYYDKKYLYGKTGPELLSARAEVDRI